jgi:hypothetical protein
LEFTTRATTRPGEPARTAAKALGVKLGGEDADAREVAAGPRETGDQAPLDQVAADGEDDRDRRRKIHIYEITQGLEDLETGVSENSEQ